MKDLKIRRLRIVNYRGVEALDVAIPEAGALFRGKNMGGKTSILRAIRAALQARDVGPEAIRMGEERAEVLVDLGHVSAKRVITETGSKLTLTGPDGPLANAATSLKDLIGSAGIDPLDLYLERDKVKRRKIVLQALPVRLTRETLKAHAGAWWPSLMEQVNEADLEAMHGLEACARVRALAYDERKGVNASHKAALERVAACEAELEKLGPTSADAPTIAVATAAYSKAAADVVALETEARLAAEAEARQAEGRANLERGEATRAGLRQKAAGLRVDANAKLPAAHEKNAAARAKMEAARKAFADAETEAGRAGEEVRDLEKGIAEADRLDGEASRIEAANVALRAALDAGAKAPAAGRLEAAREEVARTERGIQGATRSATAKVLRDKLAAEREAEAKLSERAGKLTHVVNLFTHDVPSALLASSDTIPGVGIAGDDVTLNGVGLDTLSGREQLVFAVEVARRANGKAKILIVDQLERLDPERLRDFVREATRDDWQLIGTRVDAGDVVIEAIEIEEPATPGKE